uniref:Versican n=1 Tax=Oryzias sinensis TaxID=183150 RepID=A0A8C8DQX8_9TELE
LWISLTPKNMFYSTFVPASPQRIQWRSSGTLAGKVVLPCSFTMTSASHSASTPLPLSAEDLRIKWVKLEGQDEKLVLVAQNGMVKAGQRFHGRVSVQNHPPSVGDASLVMDNLRASDAGLYHCEVVHGLDNTRDTVSLNVSGVVFHYRANSSRYTLDFHQAKEACRSIHASIATPPQLDAAFQDGLDQCDAGWLADQSVRYPITRPRRGCEGDLMGHRGVRTYGVRDATEKYDVYCFIDQLNGNYLTLTPEEACERHDAALASPGQLFAAWRAGFNRCDYGWLSDGSVRHPVTVPLPQCGGGLLGVRTLYKHKNQTGYPDPEERHGAFCFKGKPEIKSNRMCGALFLLKLLKVLYIKTFCNFKTKSETKHLHTHENIKEHIKTLNGRMEITHSTGREIKPKTFIIFSTRRLPLGVTGSPEVLANAGLSLDRLQGTNKYIYFLISA